MKSESIEQDRYMKRERKWNLDDREYITQWLRSEEELLVAGMTDDIVFITPAFQYGFSILPNGEMVYWMGYMNFSSGCPRKGLFDIEWLTEERFIEEIVSVQILSIWICGRETEGKWIEVITI